MPRDLLLDRTVAIIGNMLWHRAVTDNKAALRALRDRLDSRAIYAYIDVKSDGGYALVTLPVIVKFAENGHGGTTEPLRILVRVEKVSPTYANFKVTVQDLWGNTRPPFTVGSNELEA